MYAVIKTGGKQYRVTPGEEVKVEKIPGLAETDRDFLKLIYKVTVDILNAGYPEDLDIFLHFLEYIHKNDNTLMNRKPDTISQ